MWLTTLSDDERLVEEHARSHGVETVEERSAWGWLHRRRLTDWRGTARATPSQRELTRAIFVRTLQPGRARAQNKARFPVALSR